MSKIFMTFKEKQEFEKNYREQRKAERKAHCERMSEINKERFDNSTFGKMWNGSLLVSAFEEMREDYWIKRAERVSKKLAEFDH